MEDVMEGNVYRIRFTNIGSNEYCFTGPLTLNNARLVIECGIYPDGEIFLDPKDSLKDLV